MGDRSPPGVVPPPADSPPAELPATLLVEVRLPALSFERALAFGPPLDRERVLEELGQCIDEVQRQVGLNAGSSGAWRRPEVRLEPGCSQQGPGKRGEAACLATQTNLRRQLDDARQLRRRLDVVELQWQSAERRPGRAWEAASDCATISSVASEPDDQDFAPCGGERPPSLWAARPPTFPPRLLSPGSPHSSLSNLPWVTPQADSELFPCDPLDRPGSSGSNGSHSGESIVCWLPTYDDANDTTDDNMAAADDDDDDDDDDDVAGASDDAGDHLSPAGVGHSERSSSLFDSWRSARHRIVGTLRLMGRRRRIHTV